MKKNYFSLLLMTLVCAFAFTACKKNNDGGLSAGDLLIAKQPWTISSVIDETNGGQDVTSSFSGKTANFADGKYTHNLGSATEAGTYELSGTTITLTPASGTAYAGSFTDVNVTADQLTFKVTVTSTKTGNVIYAVTMK